MGDVPICHILTQLVTSQDMTEWDDVVFDGTWKYLCIDIENRIKVIDWDAHWKTRLDL